jgi:hypothetical protein
MEDLTLRNWFSVHDRATELKLDLHGAEMHDAKKLIKVAWKRFAGGSPARRRRRFRGVYLMVEVYPPLFAKRTDERLSKWWEEIEDFRRRQLSLFPDLDVHSIAREGDSAA